MASNINLKESFQEFKNLISIDSFRKLLTYTLITTTTFYFTSINFSSINLSEPDKIFENYIVLKFIAVSIAVNFMFYRFPRFLLRNIFHLYLRNKFSKKKTDLKNAGGFKFLKNMHEIYSILIFVIKNYVFKLGYFSIHELEEDFNITEEIKDELLNELLVDCYKWICTLIHFIITLCFIWKYLNPYLIFGSAIVLLFFLMVPFVTIPFVMNLELLNKIRLDVIRDRKKALQRLT